VLALGQHLDVDLAAGGVNLSALPTRFITICSIRVSSPSTHTGSIEV
jgi:hypothetical protein